MTAPVDIFISYKREERALAQDVGRVLQEAGYTTVTDLNIKKSKDFGDAIDEMIRQARLVVVLWTPMSANSNWVKMEAREANTLQKYFGVVMKPLERRDLPLELRRKQYLDLGGKMPRDLSLVVQDVASLIGEGSNTEEEANVASEELNDDFHLFQVVDRLGYAEGYQAYLDDYPNGIFATRAKSKITGADNMSVAGIAALEEQLSQAQQTIQEYKRDTGDAEKLRTRLAEATSTIQAQDREIIALKKLNKPFLERISFVWLVPVLALLVSGYLMISSDPEETGSDKRIAAEISFQSGGDTDDHFKAVKSGIGESDATADKQFGNRFTYDDLPGSLQCATFPWTFAQTLKWGFEATVPSLGQLSVNDKVHGVILKTSAGDLCLPTTLQSLKLRGADVEDISVIGYLPELRELFLEGANVKDILPITTLGKLQLLGLDNSSVVHLDGLEGVKSLRDIRLDRTPVASLEPLAKLPNIHHLRVTSGEAAGNPLIDTESTRAAVRALIAKDSQ